jgi:hypothetical protein
MRRKHLTFLLAAVVVASPLQLAAAAPENRLPRNLARATAALAQADETPPPTRSQVLAQQQREEAARAVAEKKKVQADAPYYKKWWFWALTGAIVGGTVALGFWAIEPSPVPARACSLGVIGCFGDGRSSP